MHIVELACVVSILVLLLGGFLVAFCLDSEAFQRGGQAMTVALPFRSRKQAHVCIRIQDGMRQKFSPWFDTEAEALRWLNDPETQRDLAFRFACPLLSVERFVEPEPGGRSLVCEEYRYLELDPEGDWT